MNDCIFCKIVANELPSWKVHETERAIAILDIHPVHPGHTLVIPKQHSTNIFDIPKEDWMAMNEIVHTIAPAVEEATEADGINLMMNNRAHAGQVIDHPHIHVIPRYKGDKLNQWPSISYKEGEKEDVLGKIREALNA